MSLQIGPNVCLGVLLYGLSLVEKTGRLAVRHSLYWVATSINDVDRIPIGLDTVRHKLLEVWVQHRVKRQRS